MKTAPEELDLHGLTVSEAIPLVDEFLYKSYQSGLRRVWIIHGRGTGVLRTAVRRHLSSHSLVLRCATAEGYRGGLGSTQVEIAD